jgi:hypothetical protein
MLQLKGTAAAHWRAAVRTVVLTVYGYFATKSYSIANAGVSIDLDEIVQLSQL